MQIAGFQRETIEGNGMSEFAGCPTKPIELETLAVGERNVYVSAIRWAYVRTPEYTALKNRIFEPDTTYILFEYRAELQ